MVADSLPAARAFQLPLETSAYISGARGALEWSQPALSARTVCAGQKRRRARAGASPLLRRLHGSRRIRRAQHGRRPVVGRHAVIISRVFRRRAMVAGRGIIRAARQDYCSKYNQKGAIHRLSKGNITAQARRESTCKVFLRQWPPSAITTPRAHAYGICRFLPSDLLCTHGCNRRRRLPWTLNRSRVLSGSRWACWS